MTWKRVFLCVIYSNFFTNCDSCLSSGKKPEPPKLAPLTQAPTFDSIRNLYVEGNVNGNVTQRSDDLTPKTIYFKAKNRIEYLCYQNYTDMDSDEVTIQWVHKRGGVVTLYGNVSSHSCRIQMELYKFDNDSVISCTAYKQKNEQTNILKSFDIPMYLSEMNSSEVSSLVKNENVMEGQLYKKPDCKNQGDLQVVPLNNSKTITNHRYAFVVTKEHNGMILFCVSREVKDISVSVVTIRKIHSITKLQIKSLEVETTTLPHTGNTTDSEFSPFLITVTVAAVVTVVLTATCVLCMCKRKRIQGGQETDVRQHSEPVYAAPQQIIYAQLQMADNVRSAVNRANCPEEPSPYAEIVGVLEPCHQKD